MEELNIFGDLKIMLKDDVLALISEKEALTFSSSAVYRGGLGKAKAILNVQVPNSYDQKLLHEHPEKVVLEAARKLNLDPQLCVGMITAADIRKFSMRTSRKDYLTVCAIVTAGCNLAETAGENVEISISPPGTINIIVAIDGNPTESCMLQTFITATEAKTAALRDLDVRSTYTGDYATGTVTDSLTIVSTNKGPEVRYGGPASKLGSLIGYCTREAVKSAILNSGNISPKRSLWRRLSERKLPIEELVSEVLRRTHAKIDPKEVTSRIAKEPLMAFALMAAANMDMEIKMGLIPEEFGDLKDLTEKLAQCLTKGNSQNVEISRSPDLDSIDLKAYPLLKSLLFHIITEKFNKA